VKRGEKYYDCAVHELILIFSWSVLAESIGYEGLILFGSFQNTNRWGANRLSAEARGLRRRRGVFGEGNTPPYPSPLGVGYGEPSQKKYNKILQITCIKVKFGAYFSQFNTFLLRIRQIGTG